MIPGLGATKSVSTDIQGGFAGGLVGSGGAANEAKTHMANEKLHSK